MKLSVRIIVTKVIVIGLVKSVILEANSSCVGVPNNSIFPDPDNCYGFLLCRDGVLQTATCPGNMWFNPETLVCDVGKCKIPTTTAEPTTSTTENSTETDEDTTTIIDTTTYEESTTDSSTESDILTDTTTIEITTITTIEPDDEIEDGIVCPDNTITNQIVFLPSVLQCNRYYMCLGGKAHVMYCTEGLHWNPNIDKCDYPKNADCASRITTTTNLPPDPTELPKCSTNGVEFHPHPTNCNLYISCLYGYRTIQHCPYYHYWDRDLKKCLIHDHYVAYC